MSDEMDGGAALIDAVEPAAVDNSAVTETPVTETATHEDTSTPEVGAETTDDSDLLKEDGSERTPEERKAFREEKANAAAGKAPLPQEVRRALKSLRDSDPKNEAIVKQLHGHFERFEALKTLGAGNVSEVKALLSDAGVKNFGELRQAFATQSQSAEAVKQTDALLYEANPKLWANVVDDLNSSGHPEAFGKLAGPYLDTLKAHDSEAYHSEITARSMEHLRASGFAEAVNSLASSVADNPKALGIVQSIATWFNNGEEASSSRAKEAQELSKLEQAKADWQGTQDKAATTAFENNVAETADKDNNVQLGRALAPFLKMPYFKDFPRDSKILMGNQIKNDLYAALKADKTYQNSMSAYWRSGTGDANKTKMLASHSSWLKDNANRVVTNTIQRMYPGYAKGGSASGRVAAATAKKTADTAAGRSSVTNNKPIYIPQKPAGLIREAVKVGNREYSRADLEMMLIAGRGFVKSTDGKSHRLITWRKAT